MGGSLPRYHRAVSTAVLAPDRLAEGTSAGTGHLRVAKHGRRSVVCRAFACSPLRLLTPANHGAAAWIYASSYGGGLVGGDAIRLSVEVGQGAAAFISTQSSTKAYRSDLGATTSVHARVGDGALLVLAPDPIVCFAGSSCRQSQHIDIAGAGALVLVDCLSSGRRAAGERWAFDRYSSRTTVRVDGRLIFYDGLSLDSTDGDIAGRMGRFDVVATVLVVGPSVSAAADAILGDVQALPVVRRSEVLTAAAPVAGHGIVLRLAGVSVEQVTAMVRKHLAFVPSLLGDDPWSRKW